jgi:hypothetical protein
MYLHFPLHLVQVAFGTALTTLIDILAERMKKTETVEVTSHLARLSAEASEASSSSSESGHEISETFVIRFFWVTAGLILCFNAFIKLVNTPVKGGKKNIEVFPFRDKQNNNNHKKLITGLISSVHQDSSMRSYFLHFQPLLLITWIR